MLKVGIILPQEWTVAQTDSVEAYETMARVAREAEELGFHSIWLFDHLHSTTSPQPAAQAIFECWISTAAIARDTKHIRIGQLVTCNSFRPPALLAKMASTVDVLSHGRLILGLGAGWHEPEYLAYGYAFPDTATRLRQLREALQMITALWTEAEAYVEGRYIHVRGAINQPKGVQKPHIPILVGGKGEQVTLKLVARYADACNFTHPSPEELAHKFALIERYCEQIGRDPREIQHSIYVNGCPGKTEAEASEKVASAPGKFSLEHIRTRGLFGTPEMIRQRLFELEQQDVHEVIVSLRDIAQSDSLRMLAQCIN